jgi:hypothetical protein
VLIRKRLCGDDVYDVEREVCLDIQHVGDHLFVSCWLLFEIADTTVNGFVENMGGDEG